MIRVVTYLLTKSYHPACLPHVIYITNIALLGFIEELSPHMIATMTFLVDHQEGPEAHVFSSLFIQSTVLLSTTENYYPPNPKVRSVLYWYCQY